MKLSYIQEERIKICKDAIEQIKAKFYIATCGTYVGIPSVNKEQFNAKFKNKEKVDFQQVLFSETITHCKTCAKGALFLSHVRRNNNVQLWRTDILEDEVESDQIHDELKNVFEIETLQYAEAAYECSYTHLDTVYYTEFDTDITKADKAVAFGKQYDDQEERLIAILENMIANKGEFNP